MARPEEGGTAGPSPRRILQMPPPPAVVARNVSELRSLLAQPEPLHVRLNGSLFELGGEALNVSGVAVVEGEGATFDGGHASRVFHVTGDLVLRDARLMNGKAHKGGCVLVAPAPDVRPARGNRRVHSPRLRAAHVVHMCCHSCGVHQKRSVSR